MAEFLNQGADILTERETWEWRDDKRSIKDPFWNNCRLLMLDAVVVLGEARSELEDRQLSAGMTMLSVSEDEMLSVCIAACDEVFSLARRASKKVVSGYLAAHLLTDVLREKYGKAISQEERKDNAENHAEDSAR